MAEISLKIKSDFAQAEADFKSLIGTSEKLQKVNDVNSKEYKALSNQIDRYIEKNKLSTVAMTATQGKSAALAAEYKKLQTQIQSLISKGLDPMSPALDKMRNRMMAISSHAPKATGEFTGMASAIKTLGMGFGAYQIANKLLDIGKASLSAAANMEQQTVAFSTMLDSTQKADSLLKSLQEFAASTPFSFNELTDASKKMLVFGFSMQEIIPNMRRLGDISAGLSMPVGDLVYLFGQVRSQGRAMTQDLNQFAARGIPIYDELAKVLGVSTAQVKQFASEGKIGFSEIDQAFKNMTENGGKFAGLMDAQSKTLSGKWSNFGDNLDRIAVTIGKKMTPAASGFLDLMNTFLESDSAEYQRKIQNLIDMQEKYMTLEKQGSKEALYYKSLVLEAEKTTLIENGKTQAILVSSTATAKERLEIYKQIAGKSKEEAQIMGLIAGGEEIRSGLAASDLDIYKKRGVLTKEEIKAQRELSRKTPGATGGTGTKKTEEQIFQDRLNLMQNMEAQSNAKRAKAAEDFFVQKLDLEYQYGMDLVAWQLEQDALIENNARLTAEQKIAAHEAASKAIAERQKKDVKMYTDFGQHMLSNTGSILTDLQTVFKNAGKESKALGYMLKGVAIGEATINSYLAFTKALAAFPPPFNYVAAGITLAAGLAKVAAIASTPISAQTGLTSYEVPDIRQYRNDGAPVKAQAGETVTVTPRGESAMGVTNVSIKIGEAELFSIVQKGINTGEISITNNNIGRGVFAV